MEREGEDLSSQSALEAAFYGIDPKKFCEDFYNALDEAAIDGMDVFEKALHDVVHARQPRGSSKASVLDSAMAAEIKEGTDRLTDEVLKAHQKPGDVLEVYWRKNIFAIGEPYRAAARDHIQAQRKAAGTDAGSGSKSSAGAAGGGAAAGDVAERHKQLGAEIAELEAALAQERSRARALQHVHSLYTKRLPEAEEADAALGEMLRSFKVATGGVGVEEALPSFMEKAGRLRDMCDRLSAATPLKKAPATPATNGKGFTGGLFRRRIMMAEDDADAGSAAAAGASSSVSSSIVGGSSSSMASGARAALSFDAAALAAAAPATAGAATASSLSSTVAAAAGAPPSSSAVPVRAAAPLMTFSATAGSAAPGSSAAAPPAGGGGLAGLTGGASARSIAGTGSVPTSFVAPPLAGSSAEALKSLAARLQAAKSGGGAAPSNA